MNYDSLERELNNELKAIYLIYGEEQYLVQMALKKIKKRFGELVLRDKLYYARRIKYRYLNFQH